MPASTASTSPGKPSRAWSSTMVPSTDAAGAPAGRQARREVAQEIIEYCARQDLSLAQFPSAEAQAGAIADDIAYDAHDIDDGLRAGMFSIDDLPRSAAHPRGSLGDRGAPPPARDSAAGPRTDAAADHPHDRGRDRIFRRPHRSLPPGRLPTTSAAAGAAVVAFSPAMAAADRTIKSFLFPRMYRHPRIMRIMGEAEAVVRALFERYQRDPGELPWVACGTGHAGVGASDRRFHRRDDRPLRAFRAHAAF